MSRRREPIEAHVNQVVCGDAVEVLRQLPSDSVHLVVTSPPYWNLVDYGVAGQIGQSSYERYLDDLLEVWVEAERVLLPNGKLCINTAIVPVPKKDDKSSHTRHLKNLNNDIEFSILHSGRCKLQRYSLFICQKQTSVKMFGSYPYPPNLYEDNTIEFINVFVKAGKPRSLPKVVKERSKLTQEQWLNLTMQVWPIYPEDVARTGGHPAPFPVKLPQRLILMYTFAAVPQANFPGDIVLDPFCGTGATCLAAKCTGRRFIGIELNPEYAAFARHRLGLEQLPTFDILIPRVRLKSSTSDTLQGQLFEEARCPAFGSSSSSDMQTSHSPGFSPRASRSNPRTSPSSATSSECSSGSTASTGAPCNAPTPTLCDVRACLNPEPPARARRTMLPSSA